MFLLFENLCHLIQWGFAPNPIQGAFCKKPLENPQKLLEFK